MAKIGDLPVRHVLIDRCSISTEKRDRLTVFRASTAIVANMTRPMWFFDEARLLAAFGPDFSLIERFSGFEQMSDPPSEFNGYILERAAG
jgi:hypothetical protein